MPGDVICDRQSMVRRSDSDKFSCSIYEIKEIRYEGGVRRNRTRGNCATNTDLKYDQAQE